MKPLRLYALILAAAALCLYASWCAADVTIPTTQPALWRSTVVAGGDTLVWATRTPRAAQISTADTFVLAPPATPDSGTRAPRRSLVPQESPTDRWLWAMVRVPAGLAPGAYKLWQTNTGLGFGLINVIAPPEARPVATLAPPPGGADESAAIQALLDAGKDVELLPGTHYLARAVTLRPGSTVRGTLAGAVRLIRWPSAEKLQPCFYHADIAAVRDLTIDLRGAAATGQAVVMYIHPSGQTPPSRNLELTGLVVLGGSLGEWPGGGALIADCVFHRSCANGRGQALFHRCTFVGVSGGNAFYARGVSEMAVVECVWEDTDRGPVFNVSNGATSSRNLLARIAMRGQEWVDNGCEGISVEGSGSPSETGRFDFNVVAHVRQRGEGSAIQLDLIGATGNYLGDVLAVGGDVWFRANNSAGQAQSGNWIDACELRGGRLRFGPFARANLVTDTAVVGQTASAHNQFQRGGGVNAAGPATFYAPLPAIDAAPAPDGSPTGNVLRRSCVRGVPREWAAIGVTREGTFEVYP